MSSEPKKRGPNTEEGLQVLREKAKKLDHSAWTRNPEAVEAIEVARRLRTTKHGMYASVPIICKSEACPYARSCPLVEAEIAPYGEKCPIEIAAIEDLFERYAEQFNIDLENRKPSETVDLMMIKDLVDADIGLLRCDNKMAWDADYVIHNTVGMTEEGEAITRQELHPLTEYREKLINRKHKTFQLLNSTRKDKEGSRVIIDVDPSEKAAEMLRVRKEIGNLEDEEEQRKLEYFEKMKRINGDQEEESEVIEVEPVDFDFDE